MTDTLRAVAQHAVAMYQADRGPAAEEARGRLARALAGASVGAPDETGVFEIVVDAADQEAALSRVWDAIAAAGADDHVVFLEHPDLPDHWRHRAGRPSA